NWLRSTVACLTFDESTAIPSSATVPVILSPHIRGGPPRVRPASASPPSARSSRERLKAARAQIVSFSLRQHLRAGASDMILRHRHAERVEFAAHVGHELLYVRTAQAVRGCADHAHVVFG